MYPSGYEDWIDPKSILGVIVVLHAEIGEAIRGSRSYKELLDDSVFFYNAAFKPADLPATYGQLIPIPLPPFHSSEWPLPDMATSEAFRAKFWRDFQESMKPSTGSKITRLSWFVPIGVFIDLFAIAEENMHKTPTMFVFKQASKELCASLMDSGWDSKTTDGPDFIRVGDDHASLSFRYHIGRSTLYATFIYNRYRRIASGTWEAIDQSELEIPVTLHCEIGNYNQDIDVGLSWSFSDIRQEITMQIGPAAETDFKMWILDVNNKVVKVNMRNEKKHTAAMVLPPKRLKLVPQF